MIDILTSIAHGVSKAFEEPPGHLLELQRVVTWIKPERLRCDHCRSGFEALTWGTRRFTNAGDLSLRDELNAEVEAHVTTFLGSLMPDRNRVPYDVRCPSCSKFQRWMIRRSWPKRYGPTAACGVLSTAVVALLVHRHVDPVVVRLAATIGGFITTACLGHLVLRSDWRIPRGARDPRVRALTVTRAVGHPRANIAAILSWYKEAGGPPVTQGRLFILTTDSALLVTKENAGATDNSGAQ